MSGWANHIEPTSGTRLDHDMGPRIKKSIASCALKSPKCNDASKRRVWLTLAMNNDM
jgi:hypothetical protein